MSGIGFKLKQLRTVVITSRLVIVSRKIKVLQNMLFKLSVLNWTVYTGTVLGWKYVIVLKILNTCRQNIQNNPVMKSISLMS
jgi:hypothetical protein